MEIAFYAIVIGIVLFAALLIGCCAACVVYRFHAELPSGQKIQFSEDGRPIVHPAEPQPGSTASV